MLALEAEVVLLINFLMYVLVLEVYYVLETSLTLHYVKYNHGVVDVNIPPRPMQLRPAIAGLKVVLTGGFASVTKR